MGNKTRLFYIDNLRAFAIILVVLQHLAVTYSSMGDWYYMDAVPLSLPETGLFGYYQSVVQAFFMGMLFLISGYFVPSSYNKKGFGGFIKERILRLGIPALIYMGIINPFILYVQLDLNWLRPKPSIIRYYIDYFARGDIFSGSGPLWFAIVLLAFSIIYALLRRVKGEVKLGTEQKHIHYSGKNAIALILVIAALAFLIRIVQPIGTSVFNMQLCFFAQYICLFIVGVVLSQTDAFSQISYRAGKGWLWALFLPGTFLWVALMLFGGALEGSTAYTGGFTWQSLVYCLWESFAAVGISAGLIAVFREKHNQQSRLQELLSENSFAVYMFHAPIIIAAAQLARPLSILPIFKFLLLSIVCVPLCFAISHIVIRRIPLLNKVL